MVSRASSEVMHWMRFTIPYYNVKLCDVCKVPNTSHIACQHWRVTPIGMNQWKSTSGKIEHWGGNFSVRIKRICIYPLILNILLTLLQLPLIEVGNAVRPIATPQLPILRHFSGFFDTWLFPQEQVVSLIFHVQVSYCINCIKKGISVSFFTACKRITTISLQRELP